MHDGFITGVETAGWNIMKLLKIAYQILKDSPARREDYISVTGSNKFPVQFYSARYVDRS